MPTTSPPIVGEGPDVLSAVQSYWLLRPDLQALTSDGALWHLAASEPVPEAYCTVFLVSEVPEFQGTRRRGAVRMYRSTIQVNCHAPTDAQARAIGLAVREALDGAPLVIGGRDVMHCLPDTPGIAIGDGLGAGGRDCWVATETFDILWTT